MQSEENWKERLWLSWSSQSFKISCWGSMWRGINHFYLFQAHTELPHTVATFSLLVSCYLAGSDRVGYKSASWLCFAISGLVSQQKCSNPFSLHPLWLPLRSQCELLCRDVKFRAWAVEHKPLHSLDGLVAFIRKWLPLALGQRITKLLTLTGCQASCD